MRTIKIGGRELGIALWCKPIDIRQWDFGYERTETHFATHAWWFGPFHLLVCDTRPLWERLPSVGVQSNEIGVKTAGGHNV